MYTIKILIIDSDINFCETLKSILNEEKFIADYVHDGANGIRKLINKNYDIVTMDLVLPDMDSLEVVKYLRDKGNTIPILILSAEKEKESIITALDAGADDYLGKPFHTGELLARLRALHRRNTSYILKEDVVSFADITLNLSKIELSSREKKEYLTQKEFQLIKLFMYNPYRVLRKDMLISKIWPFDDDVCYNTLEAHISSLRKKMKQLDSRARIVTIRGIGYKMEA